jgi:hypothetical protein
MAGASIKTYSAEFSAKDLVHLPGQQSQTEAGRHAIKLITGGTRVKRLLRAGRA